MSGVGVLFGDFYEFASFSGKNLSTIAGSGLTQIGTDWNCVTNEDGTVLPSAKDLAEKLRGYGLVLSTINAPIGRLGAMSDRIIRQLITSARQLGAGFLTISAGGACSAGAEPDSFKRFLVQLGTLIPYAKENGLVLAIQKGCDPLQRYCDSNIRLIQIMQELNDDNIRLCIDTGLSNMYGSVLEDYYLLEPWLVQVNLSDSINRVYNCIRPGTGSIPWNNCLQPGYGNVPWSVLGNLILNNPKINPFLACHFFDGTPLSIVLEELHALFEKRVYLRPDGGFPGRYPDSRKIILK